MLTPQQLADIDRHLRQDNWLLNEALIAELVDHYANAISEKMAQGKTINDAVHEVDASFGGVSGLADLEQQYVETSNKAAWKDYRTVLVRYALPPRLLALMGLYYGLHLLINQYGLDAFLLLWIPAIGLTVLVGLPFAKWEPGQWRFDWENRPLKFYYQRKYSGNQRVSNIVTGIAINLPTWVFMFYHPLTYKRSNEAGFLVIATIGLTLTFLALATIAELTHRQNPIFRYFAKPD